MKINIKIVNEHNDYKGGSVLDDTNLSEAISVFYVIFVTLMLLLIVLITVLAAHIPEEPNEFLEGSSNIIQQRSDDCENGMF